MNKAMELFCKIKKWTKRKLGKATGFIKNEAIVSLILTIAAFLCGWYLPELKAVQIPLPLVIGIIYILIFVYWMCCIQRKGNRISEKNIEKWIEKSVNKSIQNHQRVFLSSIKEEYSKSPTNQ